MDGWLEDTYNLEDEISQNPGRYMPDPSFDDLIDAQEYEDWCELQAEHRAAQNGTL